MLAVTDGDVVDEGVVHVAREDDVVAGGAAMAKNVQQHLGSAAVGHPVFGVDYQRVAGEGEQLLDTFNEFDAEHRCGRDDDHRGLVQQALLQLGQCLPVHQARRAEGAALAAPAAGAGIQHDQAGRAGNLVLPAVKAQHGVDAGVLLADIQTAAALCILQQLGQRIQRFCHGLRVVAPALTQQVRQHRVADDLPGEGVAVGGALPVGGEVPVVGDVVVVKDHQTGLMGEQAGDLRQAVDKGVNLLLFALVTLALFVTEPVRHRRLNQAPGNRRPHQQVHGQHLGQADQVVVGVGRGKHRLAYAAKETVAHRHIRGHIRQQLLAAIVGVVRLIQGLTVGDGGAFQGLVEQPESGNHLVNCDQ